MPLAVYTAAAEEVNALMTDDATEDVDKVEEDVTEEATEEAAVHMKMGFKYKMSPVTLKMQSGPHSQMRQEQGYQRTQYTLSCYRIKRY